jgi:hypothetical protein
MRVQKKSASQETAMELPAFTYHARDDESSILRSHVSEARKRAFLQSYLNDRAKTATTETLFRSVNAFTLEPEFSNREAFGFDLLLLKAPFVEGSSWLPYSTLEFALAAERHLLKRLERVLHESAADTQEQADSSSWTDLLRVPGAFLKPPVPGTTSLL